MVAVKTPNIRNNRPLSTSVGASQSLVCGSHRNAHTDVVSAKRRNERCERFLEDIESGMRLVGNRISTGMPPACYTRYSFSLLSNHADTKR